MKTFLVNPPITSRERYGRDIADVGGHQAPLGLCSIAAVAEQSGHQVTILDAELLGLDESGVLDRVAEYGPDVVGLTSTTVAYPRAERVASMIGELMPDVPIVIGGCHVTSNPRETMESGAFDVAVLHEGEWTLPDLLAALQEGRDLGEVPGIAYRQDGRTVFTARRPYIEDLDTLPCPAFHLLESRSSYLPPIGCYRNKPVVNLVTSRGCPYQCIFCDKTVFGMKYRFNSADYVLAQVDEVVQRFGAREIAFLDDSFTVRRDRVLDICAGLRRRHPGLTWTCMTRANLVDRDLLRAMKRAGCWQVAVGVESASQAVLDLVQKGETLDEVEQCIRDAAGVGLMVKGFFVLGLPGGTRDTIARTIAFAKSVPLTDVVVTIATPMPGSLFYEVADQYGRHERGGWEKLSYWWPVFVPWGLSPGLMLREQRRFYRSFYGRVSVLGRQLRKIGSGRELLKYLQSARRILGQRSDQELVQRRPPALPEVEQAVVDAEWQACCVSP